MWQPIETAPKDGTWILAVIGKFIPLVVQWNESEQRWLDKSEDDCSDDEWEFVTDGDYDPTHWMPLPEPPSSNSA